MPPKAEDFQKELNKIFKEHEEKSELYVDVNSGDLHRRIGIYPKPHHRMPLCCLVMKRNMKSGDKILQEPPSGQGVIIIHYTLPRY